MKEGEREKRDRQAGRPDGGGIAGNLTATLLAKLFSIDRSSSSQRRNSPELSRLNLSKSVAEEEEHKHRHGKGKSRDLKRGGI